MPDKLIGMYVHQHWPYNHPYAARTWSLEDWRGYADGLCRIGFNSIMIWPMLETMPSPLTRSDRACLEGVGNAIGMLKGDFGMRVITALCPNVAAVDEVAARTSCKDRHFFHCDIRVNPADSEALDRMLRWRGEILAPLKETDAISIIDSDPGGYPGSTNEEFVHLLAEHRKLFDRLRPGIELIYWVHAGWEAYSRFYETGKFEFGLEEEFVDTLKRLAEIDPEPWGIANGLEFAEPLGLRDRVLGFNYGAIEGEPTFPLTNFTPESAREIGARDMPRGVLGNAQTHCVQLPNTFAFARGAQGKSVEDADLLEFAGGLIPDHAELILSSWKAMETGEPKMRAELSASLEEIQGNDLRAGELGGLLLGSSRRFLNDLVLQLRLKAACGDLCAAVNSGGDHKDALRRFVHSADLWQAKHGYRNRWEWPELAAALEKLGNREIDRALDQWVGEGEGFAFVKSRYFREETQTLTLLQALKRALIGEAEPGGSGVLR